MAQRLIYWWQRERERENERKREKRERDSERAKKNRANNSLMEFRSSDYYIKAHFYYYCIEHKSVFHLRQSIWYSMYLLQNIYNKGTKKKSQLLLSGRIMTAHLFCLAVCIFHRTVNTHFLLRHVENSIFDSHFCAVVISFDLNIAGFRIPHS